MSEKKYSILLVEDEEHLQEALKLNLELEDYSVTSSYNGADALKAVQQEHFDLMILDVMLPELDGISVCSTPYQYRAADLNFKRQKFECG